jgi:hypothetical protein
MRTQGKTRLRRGSSWIQGNWQAVEVGNNRRIAYFSCPVCGRPFTCMDSDVKDGEVNPSVGCPYVCPVNWGVKLEGWSI